MLIIDKILLT